MVKASNTQGEDTKELSITIHENVGIGQWSTVNAQLKIYPNPTTGQLTIVMNNEQLIMNNVEIYNVVGQSVGAYPCGRPYNNEITIDISHLPAGMYFLRIGNKTTKIIKN